MVHTLVKTSIVGPPPPVYQFVMTGPPSQFSRLMASAKVSGPWTQINLPDGSFGQTIGTNYNIPNSPLAPTLFFTTQPSP